MFCNSGLAPDLPSQLDYSFSSDNLWPSLPVLRLQYTVHRQQEAQIPVTSQLCHDQHLDFVLLMHRRAHHSSRDGIC